MQGRRSTALPEETHGRRRANSAQPAAARPTSDPAKRAPATTQRPPADLTKEQELGAYRDMLLIRRFEEKAGQMYGMGLIGGFCHLYIGQEAVVVGMQMALKQGDQVITGYRDHGHMLACGMDAKGVMAELTGRRGGYSKGKGGSMHMFSTREGLLRRPRHRRRAGAARHRPRLRQPLPRQRQRLPDLFRRRRGQPGPGLRELQHGRAVEAAGRLRHREQPVRHGHRRSSAPRRTTDLSQARRLLRHPGRAGRRHGRARRARPPASAPSSMAPRGQGALSSSRCRPTAIAATRCPTRRSTAPRRRSTRCARSTTRSSRCASACCRTKLGERGRAEGDRRRGARASSTRRPSSPPTIPSRIRPSSTPTSDALSCRVL